MGLLRADSGLLHYALSFDFQRQKYPKLIVADYLWLISLRGILLNTSCKQHHEYIGINLDHQ
jgi:hypothetical protein